MIKFVKVKSNVEYDLYHVYRADLIASYLGTISNHRDNKWYYFESGVIPRIGPFDEVESVMAAIRVLYE